MYFLLLVTGVAIGGGGGSLSYLQSPGGGIRNPISGQRSPSGHSNSSKEFISPGEISIFYIIKIISTSMGRR